MIDFNNIRVRTINKSNIAHGPVMTLETIPGPVRWAIVMDLAEKGDSDFGEVKVDKQRYRWIK